jgi:UDP-N-acetylmuramate dehydrogenase
MEVQSNVPLGRYTTLKIGGEAKHFFQPTSVDQLVEIISSLKAEDEPFYILGGGSNLLVSSSGVDGCVIRTAQLTAISSPEPDLLQADAGVRLPHVAKYAASLGLSGMEFLVGIPGTVGGAVIMNAGAHGSCVEKILESCTIYDATTSKVVELKNRELEFTYRHCMLDPLKHVVLSAKFRLKPDVREVIEQHTKANEDYRWKTQPLGWPNAGSTFKNPEPTRSAGMLLDQSGAKQFKEGGAAVSAIHANFVINTGGATSADVTDLLKRMKQSVMEKFAVNLHPEWKRLGTFTREQEEPWKSH